MLPPESKSVSSMKDIVHKLSKPGQLVLGTFLWALLTARICLFLEKYRALVSCDRDVYCLQKSTTVFIGIYVSQLLTDRSDSTRDYQLKDSVRIYLAAMEAEGWGTF